MSERVYRLSPMRRLVNFLMTLLVRLGFAPPHTYLLTVRGRKSGTLHTNPVTLVEQDGRRWLVAPYGEVPWVKNARASGQVMLSRRFRQETLSIHEVSPAERAPILYQYVRLEPVTLPFFTAGLASPLEDFAAEADRHPVFLLGDL